MTFGVEKLRRMVWLSDSEKKIEDMFIRFDRIHERDGQTDRRTPHDSIGRACIPSRGNNAYRNYHENDVTFRIISQWLMDRGTEFAT